MPKTNFTDFKDLSGCSSSFCEKEANAVNSFHLLYLLSVAAVMNLPQNGWLTTTEMYSLIILETWSPKSKHCWSHPLSGGSRGESILAFANAACSLAIHGFLGFWPHHSHLCFCLHAAFSVSIFSSVCLLQRHFSLSLESTQISQDYLKVLNLMKSAKAFVPNKETFADSMDEEADMYFKEEAPFGPLYSITFPLILYNNISYAYISAYSLPSSFN